VWAIINRYGDPGIEKEKVEVEGRKRRNRIYRIGKE